ncbi:unnamed protein product [Ostreobium quekettii]|uniref:Uncharacterized protein n=1 Tax=Ostreobium quekettii TaxID=121088 RepID=A0A8S1J7E1_9CHLO|nr:unnamed protein product [Ostreobium quekettii]
MRWRGAAAPALGTFRTGPRATAAACPRPDRPSATVRWRCSRRSPRDGAHRTSCTSTSVKRYRERQRNRRAFLESIAANLEGGSSLFDKLGRENELLRQENARLSALVCQQESLLQARQGEGGSAVPQGPFGNPAADPGLLDQHTGILQASGMPSQLASSSRAEPGLSASHSAGTHSSMDTPMLHPSPVPWAVSSLSQQAGGPDALSSQHQHQQPHWSQPPPTSTATPGTTAGPQPLSTPESSLDPQGWPLHGHQHAALSGSWSAGTATCASPSWSIPELGQQVEEGFGNPDVGSSQGTLMDTIQDRFLGELLLKDGPDGPNQQLMTTSASTMPEASSVPLSSAISDSRERSVSSSDTSGGGPGLKTVRGMMAEIGNQVRAMQGVLVAHSIRRGRDQLPASVAPVLSSMVSSITELEVRIARMRTPKPSDLANSVPKDVHQNLSNEETGKYKERLAMLGLSASQESALVDLRVGHIAVLTRIFEERTELNAKAKAAVRDSGAGSENMRSVWDLLKHNIAQEQQAVIDGLYALLLRILEPPQAALLLVDTHPGDLDVIKLTTAVAGLRSDSAGPVSSQF